jgi:putative oxidoreductase
VRPLLTLASPRSIAVAIRMRAIRVVTTSAPAATVLVRLLVGGVFVSEGMQKFLFPDALGVGRFIKIGIPAPMVMAPFVGVVEILCGLLFIVGLLTRLAAIPLIIDMLVPIASTKIAILMKSGFWAMAHEARTDYTMLLGSIFLLLVGAGPLSVDARLVGADKGDDA